MKTSDNGRKLIESFEGLILSAYDDYNDKVVPLGGQARGTLTIGYGHTTAAGNPSVYVGQSITREDADTILASDLTKVESDIGHLVSVPLNQNQYDALVSFEFNTGALGHSSGLKYLNVQDYEMAWSIFSQYDHASGRILPGLERRRKAERDLFFTAPKLGTTPTKPVQTQTLFGVIYDFIRSLVRR